MKLSKIVDAVNAKSFGETNWTYSDIYPYFSQAITEINGELDSFRQIENAPDVTEDTPYYNIAAYNAIPDTHILNYVVTYIVVAMDNAQLAVTSRTQAYVTQLAKYKQQLIADLYKWMPIREDSNIYFDLEHNGKDTRRIPYVGNCWYDEDEGGMLSCNEDSGGHYHVLPSIGVHCDNPYGYLVPRDTTQRILEGRYYYDYIFVPYEAFRPYYDPVGVRIAITGYDIPYTAIPYTTIEHLDVETITNSKGDTIVVFKNFNMRNKTISNVNVDTPTSDTHPTTKKYVDDSIAETLNYVDTTDANMKDYVDGKNELDEKVANKTSSWGSTPSDTKYPTEKLVKDNLDLKENLSNKTASWNNSVSDTRYPTEKLVKDTLDLKEDISNKITQWGGNPSDMQYPSAKLTKDTLDTKFNNANIIAESSGITNDTDKVLSSKAVNAIKTDLQNQIDGINAGQNLADIVATRAALSNLDTTKLRNNDKIQVLADENYDNASTVYSFTSPNTFTYIGKYGQDSYSKSETYTQTEVNTLLATKQSAIDAQHLLDASLVDTDSTHRFVTDSDKTNWDGKLDASNVGIVTISTSSGTLTSAQLTECNKNISVIVYGNKRVYKTDIVNGEYVFLGILNKSVSGSTETYTQDKVTVNATTGAYAYSSSSLLTVEPVSSAEISALFS